MPKITVGSDQFWPIFFEDTTGFDWEDVREIELTDQELSWIRNAHKRFWGAQAFLEKKYREASDAGSHSDSDS